MGTDCAPFVEVFSYEFEFMKSLISTVFSVAAKFSNTCRYIDDLLTLNNNDFRAYTRQIYITVKTLVNHILGLHSVIVI